MKKGKILKQWDDGHPYKIEVEEDGTDMWCPIDSDDYVQDKFAHELIYGK